MARLVAKCCRPTVVVETYTALVPNATTLDGMKKRKCPKFSQTRPNVHARLSGMFPHTGLKRIFSTLQVWHFCCKQHFDVIQRRRNVVRQQMEKGGAGGILQEHHPTKGMKAGRAVVGCCWLLLVGCCWLLLVVVGCWLLLLLLLLQPCLQLGFFFLSFLLLSSVSFCLVCHLVSFCPFSCFPLFCSWCVVDKGDERKSSCWLLWLLLVAVVVLVLVVGFFSSPPPSSSFVDLLVAVFCFILPSLLLGFFLSFFFFFFSVLFLVCC